MAHNALTTWLVDGIKESLQDALKTLSSIKRQVNQTFSSVSSASLSDWPRIIWHGSCLFSAAVICVLIVLVSSPVLILLLAQATFTTYVMLFFIGARMIVFYLKNLMALCLSIALRSLRRTTSGITHLLRGDARSKHDYYMEIRSDDPLIKFVSIKRGDMDLDAVLNKTPPPDRWNRESYTAPPSPENQRIALRTNFIFPTMTSTETEIGTRFGNATDVSPGTGTGPGPALGTTPGALRTPIGMVEPVTPLQSAHNVMEDYFFTEKGEWKRQMEERAKVRSRSGSVATGRRLSDTTSSR